MHDTVSPKAAIGVVRDLKLNVMTKQSHNLTTPSNSLSSELPNAHGADGKNRLD